MKFCLALAAAAISVTSTAAFTANHAKGGRNALTQTMAVRTDSADLVTEALAASKEFGATSSEARLAWEAVEEVDAADNSAASIKNLDDECEVENVSKECLEYNEKLEELQVLLSANFPDMSSFTKTLASSVEQIKLASPEPVAAPNSPQLTAALEEANDITKRKGIESSEAAIAWETVEEIAASGTSNAVGAGLTDDECLVEAAKEACMALEELNKIIDSRK